MVRGLLTYLGRRRVVALLAAVLLSPFWIINFGQWLKEKGWDRLLIEAEVPITDATLWLIGILSGDFIKGVIVTLIAFGLILPLGRLVREGIARAVAALSLLSSGNTEPAEKRRYVSPFEGKTPAKPEPPPENKQWKATSAYDLPIKLGVIDELLGFLGSEKECELTLREGVVLAKVWERQIKQEGLEPFILRLKDYQNKAQALQVKIHEARKSNERYEDIEYILTPKEPIIVQKTISRFIEALKKLRPTPPNEFGYFLVPLALEFEKSLKDFGHWRFQTEKALLARRKELSS